MDIVAAVGVELATAESDQTVGLDEIGNGRDLERSERPLDRRHAELTQRQLGVTGNGMTAVRTVADRQADAQTLLPFWCRHAQLPLAGAGAIDTNLDLRTAQHFVGRHGLESVTASYDLNITQLEALLAAYYRRVPWESVFRIVRRAENPTPRWPDLFWRDAMTRGGGGTCLYGDETSDWEGLGAP